MYKEKQDKLNKGYLRMCIVSIVWAFIGFIPIFFINTKYLSYYLIGWDIYFLIGILLSSKIINKIWKKP